MLLGSAGVGLGEGLGELRPLSEILQEESSNSMQVYGIERCAALFLGNAEQLRTRGESYKEEVEKYEEEAFDLTIASYILSQEYGLDRSIELIQIRIVQILTLYVERWAHNSSATGHNIGSLTQSDIQTYSGFLR